MNISTVMGVLAAYLHRSTNGRLTPNTVTFIGLGLHVLIAYCIINQQLLAAGLILSVATLCDGLDGALARLQNKATAFGGWLDACSDRLKEIILLASLTYLFVQTQEPTFIISLSTATLGIALLISYVKAKGETIALAQQQKLPQADGPLNYGWRSAVLIVTLLINQAVVGCLLLFVGGLVTLTNRVAKMQRLFK